MCGSHCPNDDKIERPLRCRVGRTSRVSGCTWGWDASAHPQTCVSPWIKRSSKEGLKMEQPATPPNGCEQATWLQSGGELRAAPRGPRTTAHTAPSSGALPLRGKGCLSVRPPVHLLYQLTTLHRVGGREQTVPDTNHELTPVSSCATSSPTAATSVLGVPKPRPPSPAPRLLFLHPDTLFLFHSLTSLVLWTQVCFSGAFYAFFK